MNCHVLMRALAALLLSAQSAQAGDLNPPVGPVAPTHKTLSQVEPRTPIGPETTPGDSDSLYRISQPGSYYLTANVLGVASKSGIEVAASNVAIDLMGFELRGVASSRYGIRADAVYSNVAIRNGAVAYWGNAGIDLSVGGSCTGTIIERIESTGNATYGIRCGTSGIISGCNATANAGIGIIGYDSSLVENCNSSNNMGSGIICGGGAMVRGCVARDNGPSGIGVTSGNIVDCSAYSNSGWGFDLGSGSMIHGCVALSNDLDGIRAISACFIRNNISRANGAAGTGAGILAGFDNHIEGNTCTSNDTGIFATDVGNFIVRNTCTANTSNWSILAGNTCLVVSAATTPAAISGNSGGVAPGSTDPNANFTY